MSGAWAGPRTSLPRLFCAAIGARVPRFRAQETRAVPRFARFFSTSEPMRLASKVARHVPPDTQRAPASPVFHVALGLFDDRDLFFQDCSSRVCDDAELRDEASDAAE